MLGWAAAGLIFIGWMLSVYKYGNAIVELKNQIITLAHYAGVSKDQVLELKEKYGIK